MEDMWVPMMRQYEHGPGALLVNTRYRDEGPFPDPERPTATIIKVKFSQPDESGMGTSADAAVIDDAWDAMVPRLAKACVEFVSRLRHGGEARILAYSPSGARSQIAAAAREAFPQHMVEIEHRDDPEWELYVASLPTPSEERVALDYGVVRVLMEHGDPLTTKRDVRHFAYFPTRDAAQSFAKQVSGKGFKTEVEQFDGDTDWRVMAARDDSVEHPQICSITGPLADLADQLGGKYDGWEAMLVKKKGLLGRMFKK